LRWPRRGNDRGLHQLARSSASLTATAVARAIADADWPKQIGRRDDRGRVGRAPEHFAFAGRHLELVERAGEVLDERGELLVDQLHAGVRGLHVQAGVLARSAGRHAHELDEQRPEPAEIGVEETELDPRIGGDAIEQLAGDRGDRRLAAQALVE
jgi:hypothetical protein